MHFYGMVVNANLDFLRHEAVPAAEDEDQAVEMHMAFGLGLCRLNS